jgi:acyl carrier protein
MELQEKVKVREFLAGLLHERDDTAPLGDSDSLFVSARLDSLSTVELIAFLEQQFGVDFGKIDFEIERVDSVDAIFEVLKELRPVPTT